MFKCILKINDRLNTINPVTGLDLKNLTALLNKLANCLDKKYKYILKEVSESSQAPIIETETPEAVEAFTQLHKDISSREMEDLGEEQREYAVYLNEFLFSKGLYIQAANSKDQTLIEISEIDFNKKATHFYSINTIQGKIISINGKSEKKPFVFIQTSRGDEHKVFIDPEHEIALSHIYKEFFLRARVKTKIDSLDGKEISSKLLSYDVPSSTGFLQSIEETKKLYPNIFANIEDSAKLLRDNRNTDY